MTHGSEWDMEIWRTRGWKCHTRSQPECDISTEGRHNFHVPRTTVWCICVYMYACTCIVVHVPLYIHVYDMYVCIYTTCMHCTYLTCTCLFDSLCVCKAVCCLTECLHLSYCTDRQAPSRGCLVFRSCFLCCLRRILTFFTVCQCFFSEGARRSDQTVLQLHTYVNWQCLIKMPSAFLSDVCKHVWNCLLETRLCVWFVWQCWNSGSSVSAVDCRNYHQATTHCELLVISTPPLHEDPQTEVDIEQDGDVDVRVRCRVVRYLYVFWLTQKGVNVLSAPIDDQCPWSYDLYKYVYYYYYY